MRTGKKPVPEGKMVRRRDAGVTLVEIIISLGIIAIALVGLVSVIIHTTRHNAVMRENLFAMRAAEKQIEVMQNTPQYYDIFKTYSQTANRTFMVPELDQNNPIGNIVFPNETTTSSSFTTPGLQLREDAVGELMGNGIDMDLNRNLAIDTIDISGGDAYDVLPVMILLKWKGIQGNRELMYRHVFLKK